MAKSKMLTPTTAATILFAAAMTGLTSAQCPPFEGRGVIECDQKTDHELCVLAASKEADRLADYEFVETLKDGNPLACKMRMAAIRQHVLYYGMEDTAATTCKRAAAVFKTNYLPEKRIFDLCEQIGFPACAGNCRHGGTPVIKSDGSCKTCDCKGGWGGKDCSVCNLIDAECLHHGNATATDDTCECNCEYPWSGVHCEQCNRRCKNGGYANPGDERCNCQCAEPWTGLECDTCGLKCKHGGNLTISNKTEGDPLAGQTCECECPALAEGPECEQCTARCLNGGVLNKETCTCECAGGFTGDQCEICDVECMYGSTFFPTTCSCYCTNPWTSGERCETCANTCHGRGTESECRCSDCEGYWDGLACDACTLRCENGGSLNAKTCKCSCDVSKCKNGQLGDDCSCACDGYWRGEQCDQCNLNCVHGELDAATCTCKCDGFFSGERCDLCDKSCEGRGLLDSANCVCDDCVMPYYGYDCAQNCTKNCQHGSYLNTERCICEQCILPWMGPECDSCKLLVDNYGDDPCGAHGVFNGDNCTCDCESGWGGELCDKCVLECAHGTLDEATCSCSCDRFWNGTVCDECIIECENGGVVEHDLCYCQCDAMHSGTFCQGGRCDAQIACDACLSVSDGCEWCASTATCSQKPAPNTNTSCVGPNRTGMCPTYGECHLCDYTADELTWLSNKGYHTLGAPKSLPGDMDEPTEPIKECANPGESWCEHLNGCTKGPCDVPVMGGAEKTKAANGFISYDKGPVPES